MAQCVRLVVSEICTLWIPFGNGYIDYNLNVINYTNLSDIKNPDSPVIAEKTCSSYYPGMITSTMLCIGKKDECKISKGTPVECSGELQGVFSWDNTEPLYEPSNGVGVLTRICAFNSWIQNEISY